MIKYIDRNGEAIEGASPIQLVEALRDGSRFGATQELGEFMQGMAQRVKDYEGLPTAPRTDSAENFIADLESAGYWTQVR